jgi:RNA polymerase sigma factor (sigma-70 family)
LDRIFHRGTVAGLAEGKLLERFVVGGDEAAFAAIVARHGPMVLGVCRRHLRDEHDVEDAFQATFLVLVRRAGAIRDGDRVGQWLYGVARRVAVRARANAARRHAHEPNADAVVRAMAAPPSSDSQLQELRAVLDEEMARLPDSLRAPLALCYLEGLTHEEVARRLRWPVGTVRSRMARARDRLRRRLARRGVAGDDAALTTALAAAPVSSALLDGTVEASLSFMTGQTAAAVTSATAAALAEGVINAMMLAKLKILGAATLACVLVLGGVQTYAFQFGGMGGARTSEKAVPKTGDPHTDLLRKIEMFQAALSESARRNAELQKQVEILRAELEALRAAKPPAAGEESRPAQPVAAKGAEEAGGRKGKRDVPAMPRYVHLEQGKALMVISPEGDRATVYYPETKQAKSIRLFEDKKTPHEVQPLATPGLVALGVKGPEITRVAVYHESVSNFGRPIAGAWYPVDLREPVDVAMPIVGPGSAIFKLGRHIYAFSSAAKRWDVLEFPVGAKPTPTFGPGSINYENDGHLYTFDDATGKWNDLDIRAILDAPEEKGEAKSRPN